MMGITVVGTGYVGLVAGACFAKLGQSVTCVESDSAKLEALRHGKLPIHEPHLKELVTAHIHNNLHFTRHPKAGVMASDIVILAVGTPPKADGSADLSQLFNAARQLAPYLNPHTNVVIKSTVPVGTAAALRQLLARLRPGLKLNIVSNPEFLREGCAVQDFLKPDRIVIGSTATAYLDPILRAYAPLQKSGVPIATMSNEAAEMCKYGSNTYLAMRVAFINELSNLCEAVGADIESVTQGMGLDRRIGQHYLKPGPGFGGSCFPKDTSALLAMADAAHVDFCIGRAVVLANEQRKNDLAGRVARALGGVLTRKTIAVLGLAFKANTDDTRDSAAIQLVQDLQARGAIVKAYDPAAKPKGLGDVALCNSLPEALAGADAAVIATEWDEFRKMNLVDIVKQLKKPVLVDFRNLFNLRQARAAGLSYYSLGRATVRNAGTSKQRRASKTKIKLTAIA